MPSTPLAAQTATGTRASTPAAPGRGPKNAKARRLRPAAQTAITHGKSLLRYAINRLRPTPNTSYHDPYFQRPDMVEDDYYRFRHQPRGD